MAVVSESVVKPWSIGETSTRHLVVVFMSTDSRSGRSLFARLVGFYTGCKYVHCELYFPGEQLAYTTDVVAGCVYATPTLRGGRPGWCMHSVAVTPRQYADALDFCRGTVGAPFATAAYYGFGIGAGCFYEDDSSSSTKQKQYVCARLVCEALQVAGVIAPDVDSRQVHTGHVYREVLPQSLLVTIRNDIRPRQQQYQQQQQQQQQQNAPDEDIMGGDIVGSAAKALFSRATGTSSKATQTPLRPPNGRSRRMHSVLASSGNGTKSSAAHSVARRLSPPRSLSSPSSTSSTDAPIDIVVESRRDVFDNAKADVTRGGNIMFNERRQ